MPEAAARVSLVCSCDGRWYPKTADEMSAVGREHDDSPWSNHVVSSQLVMSDGTIAPLPWHRGLEILNEAATPLTELVCELPTIHDPHTWTGARGQIWSCPGVRGTGPRHADAAPR